MFSESAAAVDEVSQWVIALTSAIEEKSASGKQRIATFASDFLNVADASAFATHADLVSNGCFHLFEVGHSSLGIGLGRQIAEKANQFGNLAVERRIANILGGQYCDVADYSSAMRYLETALVLARKMADATIEAACLANVIAVLQDMGHYRQAIALAEDVLKLKDSSDTANVVKLQCTSNGLFAAHRIGNEAAAARFMSEGQTYLTATTDPLRRAFFEKGRALYLVDLGQATQAKAHLNDTIRALKGEESVRIRTLLTIASAVCDWALGEKGAARNALEILHAESKVSRLYHNLVLQALIKVYSDPSTPFDATAGLHYGRELVEYTTSVKKAKFYRQLANKRDESEQFASATAMTQVDPFGTVDAWLSTTDVLAAGPVDGADRRLLAKHEELTVIHEDMARLRVAALRREIKTDAVDTAENWAIAAEFFDDETGQHCYRVGHLASMLAQAIGLDETFCVQIEHAARLHDIGKIAVNEVILLKPGPLDASEMAAMRLHTEVGAQILSGSDDPTLVMAVEVARHHHEWWNGAGYPAKLAGKAIPMSARISAYADVYDALTHARAYKRAWTHERALEEIFRLVGTQFDPGLSQAFCNVLDGYRADLQANTIPAFADMASNALIASRRKLLATVAKK